MQNKYKTTSTSRNTATVDDRVLSETTQTRKIIRPLLLENPNDSSASVKITILHQKAVKKNKFEDVSEESLANLKAKEIRKLTLSSAETKSLYEQLTNLYLIHNNQGVPQGDNSLIVANEDEIVLTDPRRADLINKMIAKGYSEEVWEQLIESDPDLATKLSHARLQHNRTKVLREFEGLLKQDLQEKDWQDFFEINTWLFGYGLNYHVLKSVTSQPYYGGQGVNGKGANKGDFLQSTQGSSKFTVLVEIKTPTTELLAKQYRNDVYPPSSDINGGTTQLRVNARRWELEGSRSDANSDQLESNKIYTVYPKMILIIGNTIQLDERAKRESFELFRRGQRDIEILTFDEVYERAKFIVEHDNPVSEPEVLDEDIPF